MQIVPRVDPTAEGEIALPPEWCAAVRTARKAAGLSQAQLGVKVGLSQAMISQIENGVAGSSAKVLAIARALDISPPDFMRDDLERRWLDAGRVLRARDPESFALQLEYVEKLIAKFARNPEEH